MEKSIRKRNKINRFFKKRVHKKYWYGFWLKHSKVNRKVILIESFHGKTIGDSGLVIAKELLRLYPGEYKIYFASKDIKAHSEKIKALGLDVHLINIESFEYTRLLATAGYIFSNASLPVYFITRDGQKYMQTWHGTPLKTLGKSMPHGIESMFNVQHNFLQATHITFPNEFTREVIMRDYCLENLFTGKVVMSGYPRNRVFMQTGKAEEIRKRYDIYDKTVYAYMPTWRGSNNREIDNTDYINYLYRILDKLDAAMCEDQLFYINFHPILKGNFSLEGYEHIKPFPNDVDAYDFLNCADALVTDYSSVFFDFSLSKKPIVLFMYDYDEYMNDRGMYLNVRDLPFRQIYDADELCKCIANDECLDDDYSETDYFRSFFNYDSVDCAEKLIKLMLLDDAGDLIIDDYSHNKEKRIKVYAPSSIKTKEELKTLEKVMADEDAVLMMHRRLFTDSFKTMFYNKYRDSFDFIITAESTPRTYLEQIASILGSKKSQKTIFNNGMMRCLPRLNADPKYVTDYGLPAEGYRIKMHDVVTVESSIEFSNDSVLSVSCDIPDGYEPMRVFYANDRYVIFQTDEIDENDKRAGVFKFDIRDAIEKFELYDKDSCLIGLMCVNNDKDIRVICFTNKARISDDGPMGHAGKSEVRAFPSRTGIFSLPVDYYKIDMKQLSRNKEFADTSDDHGINISRTDTELSLIPYVSAEAGKEVISIKLRRPRLAIDFISDPAVLKSYRFTDESFEITATVAGWKKENVVGASLIFDSNNDDTRIPLECEVMQSGKCITIRMSMDLKGGHVKKMHSLRWNVRIDVQFGSEIYNLKIRCESRSLDRRMKYRNIQSKLSNGYILYPYIGTGDTFKVSYREANEYDTVKTRIKEIIAMFLYYFLRPYFRAKRYFVIYEKFCMTAQDNSYFFMKYCMEEAPEEVRRRFYYIIDKRSREYKNIKKYEPQIIQFMSIKHMLYALSARICISTDSTPHLYTWQSKPSFVNERIHEQDVLFLQHGVTALKRVDNLFGKKGSSPVRFFVTTSPIEQDIVVRNFGFTKIEAPMLGFTRWDALVDKKDDDDKMILIMPTWRLWLEDCTDEIFENSDYYKNYRQLIQDPEFVAALKGNDLRVVFYLHPKFAKFIETFDDNLSDRISFVPFGSEPLNDLMMRCHMLITDYSSVCWDVLYMDKPVIFYQFDYDMYSRVHGSYIDMKTELPCPRTDNTAEVIKQIIRIAANGYKIPDEYTGMTDKYFAHKDQRNCARTYEFLIHKRG